MTWVAVKLASRKTLYLSSYYRSNVAGEDSLDKGKTAWTSSVNPWMEQPQIGVWRIPLHWRRLELPWLGLAIHDSEVGEPHARLHRKLMGLLHDRGLEQMVMEPMRLYNILDLYFRNAMLHTLDSGVQMVWMARIKKLSVVSKRLTEDLVTFDQV